MPLCRPVAGFKGSILFLIILIIAAYLLARALGWI